MGIEVVYHSFVDICERLKSQNRVSAELEAGEVGTGEETPRNADYSDDCQDVGDVQDPHCHQRRNGCHGSRQLQRCPHHTQGTPEERPRERTKTGTGTETAAATLLWKLHQASRPRALLLPSKRCPMPSMWEDWTLESEVPLQGQTVLLWTTRTPTQQGRQVQTETDPRCWNR